MTSAVTAVDKAVTRTSGPSGPHDQYWEKRVRSKAFRQALTGLVANELKSLGATHVKDVVDTRRVRTLIREWDARLIDAHVVADLVIEANRGLGKRLKRRPESLLGLLDPQMGADINALLDEDLQRSPHAEDFVTKLIRQEFVRRLFTDVIFTSIVSFYQRVNPLFGALTTRMMEEQIKGFIQFFMPMIERQAIAFALSEANQRIVLDFTRSIVRQLLDEPIRHYAAIVSPAQRKKAEALVRHAVGNAKLDALMRKVALAAWDDLYATMRNKRVGDILRLDAHAGWVTDRIIEVIVPALSRRQVLRFVAAEMAAAARRD